jgi:predicted transcriptional regulator
MKHIFEGLKHQPFAKHLGLSPSQFSQKLHEKTINGYPQSFSADEKKDLKSFLLFMADSIVHEVEKI